MEGLSLRPTYGKKQTRSLTSSPITRTPETQRALLNRTPTLPHKTEKKEENDFLNESELNDLKISDKKDLTYTKSELLEYSHISDIPLELKAVLAIMPEIRKKHTSAKFTPSPSMKSKSSKKTDFPHKAKTPWTSILIQQHPIIRSMTGILNKLTTDNYSRLLAKIVKLFQEISDAEIFKEFVSLIHNKAVTDSQFILMYTQLCVTLNSTPSSISPDPGFRKTLLLKCQQNFENTSLPKKEQIGNIRFVGQLYNHKLLPEKIIHWCLENLLKDVEKNCESVCILMGTVGKTLDVPQARGYMASYFTLFIKCAKNKELSPRIRFMYQDLVELRLRGWVSRGEVTVKKVPEIPQKKMVVVNEQDVFLDFFSSQDENEFVSGFKECKNHNKFVENGVLLSLEKSERERSALVKGLEYLVEKGGLKREEVVKGMKEIVGQLKELEIDVPNVKVAWKGLVKSAADAGLVSPQALPKLIV